MARIKPQALLIQSKKKKAPARIGLSTIITCNIVLILVLLLIYATYRHWYPRTTSQLGIGYEVSEAFGESKLDQLPNYAIFFTSKGSITIELHKDASSSVVAKFAALCQKGYFNGMPFHRVIKNFVIQGGHSQRSGAAADWILEGKERSKLATSPKHEAFMLGTAKANPSNQDFELFITTAPIPDLNEKLTVFGQVIKGEDVVQEIEEVDTDEHYQPKSPIGITNIVLKKEL